MNLVLVKSLTKAAVLITVVVMQKVVMTEIIKETFKD